MRFSMRAPRRLPFWVLSFVLFIMFAPVDTGASSEALLKPVPINMAEAIIEPFWIPELSGFAKWQVDPGSDHGLRIHQNWAAVDFEWASKPKVGPALHLSRDFHVDCSGYDRLLVRLKRAFAVLALIGIALGYALQLYRSKPYF